MDRGERGMDHLALPVINPQEIEPVTFCFNHVIQNTYVLSSLCCCYETTCSFKPFPNEKF